MLLPETWKLQASFEWAQAEVSGNANGGGSNLLVSDRVTRLSHRYSSSRYTQFNPDTGEVRVAGEPLPRLAWQAERGGKDWNGLLVFLAALAVLLS